MSDRNAPLSERFAAVSSLVGGYGYCVHHQAGGEDGSDWEVTFSLGSMLCDTKPQTHHCAAATEDALLSWLTRWLPEQAAREWRQFALIFEAELARKAR